jgi:heterodisulfide reductase subunit B
MRLPHLEAITVKTLKKFGINLKRLENITCCPEPFSMTILNFKAWYIIASRNLCLAERAKTDLLTLCNGCNATLYTVNKNLKEHLKLKNEVNEYLVKVGMKFEGKINVKSILSVLYNDIVANKIKEKVLNPLRGIKAAVHYGCHIFNEIKDYDDIKNPKSLKTLVESLGATVISYPSEMLCCGGFARYINEKLSLEYVKEKINHLTNVGADCLIVICPYCFLQYDIGQQLLNRIYKKDVQIPVLYYTQLLGLAMGFSAEDIGLNFHKTKADKLIKLIYG